MALAQPFNLNELPFMNRQEQTCLHPPASVVEQLKYMQQTVVTLVTTVTTVTVVKVMTVGRNKHVCHI